MLAAATKQLILIQTGNREVEAGTQWHAHGVPSSQPGPLTEVVSSPAPQLFCKGRVLWLPIQQTYSQKGHPAAPCG